MQPEPIETEITENYTRLLRFSRKLTSTREDAEDLLHESICRMLENRGSYQAGTNFKSWSYTIIRNTHLNKQARKNVEQKYIESTVKESSAYVNNNEFRYAEIKKISAILPKEQYIPLIMYAKGYKYSEIATNLKIPMSMVKNRIHSARMRLQKITKGEFL